MYYGDQPRSAVPDEYKWKLEDIFPGDEIWEKTFEETEKRIPNLSRFAGKISASANELLNCIREMHELEETIGKLYAYAHMRNDEDKTVPEYQEQYDRMGGLLVRFNQTVSFFEPELLTLSDERLEAFYKEQPELELYRHFIGNIVRMRAHTLSQSEERLMALSGEVRSAPAHLFAVWDSADIRFPKIKDEKGKEIQLTDALYGKYQQSPDRRLRKDSYMGLYVPYVEHRNMLAANYSAIVKSHIFEARARNYPGTLAAALDGNNIDETIYHNLIKTARDNLKPLHRYHALRKEVLKLTDGVHDYDLRAPLFESKPREYSWEEAKRLCLEGMRPLGEEYVAVLKESFSAGWVDVYENKGKRTGAYSSGTYGVHPYVLMNYNGTLNDVFTLAHEMGHALHTWYTINNQPFVYGDYPIFLAEVASTVNEALLQHYMIDQTDDAREKKAFLNAYLDKFHLTFYRQVVFAEFEWRSHELVEKGEALTADKLDELFGEIYRDYHGPDFVPDRETKALWSRVPHFYYDYYVFQYATSFVASLAIVADILEQGAPARKRYLDFLKSGRSKYPVETLREAGVDLTTDEPVSRALKLMDKLLDEAGEGIV